eukprot:g78934.t1
MHTSQHTWRKGNGEVAVYCTGQVVKFRGKHNYLELGALMSRLSFVRRFDAGGVPLIWPQCQYIHSKPPESERLFCFGEPTPPPPQVKKKGSKKKKNIGSLPADDEEEPEAWMFSLLRLHLRLTKGSKKEKGIGTNPADDDHQVSCNFCWRAIGFDRQQELRKKWEAAKEIEKARQAEIQDGEKIGILAGNY